MALVIRIYSPVTSGAQRKYSHLMGLVSQKAWWPSIEWLLKLRFVDESKNGRGICSSDRYMIHLYCLAVQAGFYSDVVEYWPVTQAARVRFSAVALVIRIFSPVTHIYDISL